MNFPIRPVLEEIHAIGSLGLDYLELAMDNPEAHYIVLRQQRDAIHQALDHYGMSLICHLPTFIHTADLTKSIREASLAELLDVPELSRQYAIECLDAVARLEPKSDCRVCLENLFARLTPFTTPDDFESVFKRWPHLAMTLDVGHAFIDGRGMDRIFEFLQRFGNRIDHIHISDNFGQRDDHLAVGDGAIDFKALIGALQQIHYDDTMTLEIFTTDRTDLIRSRNALQKMMGQ